MRERPVSAVPCFSECKDTRRKEEIKMDLDIRNKTVVAIFLLFVGQSLTICHGSIPPGHTMHFFPRLRGGAIDGSSNLPWNATMPPWRPGDSVHSEIQESVRALPHSRLRSPWSRSNTFPEDTESPQISHVSSNRRYRPLNFREVLNCKAPRWASDLRPKELSRLEDGIKDDDNTLFAGERQSYVDYRGRLEGKSQKLSHSPVVYQYYGRSRVRGNPSDSVHFILLGPNVDHWKVVGQTLASRGFNAIACERVENEDPGADFDRGEDSPNLVLEVLEALKWKKAILVGCDHESILTMETAMMLSPDRVAGLVLSGDLTGVNQIASAAGVDELGSFLQRVLDCPYLVVWDGDTPTVVSGSSAHDAIEMDSSDKCLILGGGSAPHRLKPEQYAWVLTRFVEERLEISFKKANSGVDRIRRTNRSSTDLNGWAPNSFFRALNLPFGINSMVSSEGRLLLGRAVAAGLFYITAMRVIFIQYGILRSGLVAIKSRYNSIDTLTKKGFQAIGAFFWNFGYIPRLFTLKRAVDDDEDDRRSGTIVIPEQQDDSEETRQESGKCGENESSELTESTSFEDGDSGEPESGSEEIIMQDQAPAENESPLFRPFFFLDNVVT